MSKWMKLSGSTAICALMTGSAAFADVTAQDVWGDWKSYMQGFGYELIATEATSGGTLTVSDITMGMTLPEGAGAMKMTIGELSFTNNGDGTVTVTMPASQEMKINVAPADDLPADVTLDYTNDGFKMLVSGSVNDMTYSYSAASIGVNLKEVVVEGTAVPIGAAQVAVRDINGRSTVKTGNLREIMQSMKAGAITYNIDFANPENAGEFAKVNGTLGLLSFDGTVNMPLGEFDAANMGEMLNAGFAVDGTYGYTGGNMNFHFADDGETVQGSSSSESGSFSVGMSRDMLKYIVGAKGQKVNFMGSEVPFPIDFSFGEVLFKMVMPVSKTDEAQDFALGITLGDFVTSDMIWGMIDPAGQLPRDPATVAFDLSGKVKLAFDMMDPEQMAAVESGQMGMPGEVESLALNNLEVTAAGASLTGKGGFDLDFPTVMMSQGQEGIDGALDLRLSGANGLMGKLVEMGLLPQEQVMSAQMMMGMFAVPAGEDVYTSKIEMKADGQVLANGQRLK
ncbi:DUF2125 domain-containing protein [Marimonas arenosa]|uniref:DUF2125 domain-containing protein n=1 Tax=Marimonas arenosa TaxID=1795305 RepID=A0AAE3WBD1_9RHOB|nr:DUF2125 domain-containing protein [Marimonas arenosa]MDQ2089831.1 DUF2125 domain-containing protein [Marimonas arenosa]